MKTGDFCFRAVGVVAMLTISLWGFPVDGVAAHLVADVSGCHNPLLFRGEE